MGRLGEDVGLRDRGFRTGHVTFFKKIKESMWGVMKKLKEIRA